jgi:uncharacterized membrane protein YczE
MKYHIICLGYYLAGAVIMSMGIELSILSNLGSGAYDAMNYHLSFLLDISLGTAMFLTVCVLFVLTMLIKPRLKYLIGFGLSFVLSFMVDFFAAILPETDNFFFRCAYFALGITAIAFGVALIIRSTYSPTPIDNLMVIVSEKTKLSVKWTKTLLEAIYALIALVIGLFAGIGMGALSIGTLIMTFTTGHIIGFFLKILKPIPHTPKQE